MAKVSRKPSVSATKPEVAAKKGKPPAKGK
jgi:hypothetical protein